MACNALLGRLIAVAQKELNIEKIQLNDEFVFANDKATEISWTDLVMKAFVLRVALSEHSHYATPIINYDKTKEKGHPFAYHVYGTSIHEVTVDCLKGTYEFDCINIVHDFGKSMNTRCRQWSD
jgi:xanthine dehydrogenase large subunit